MSRKPGFSSESPESQNTEVGRVIALFHSGGSDIVGFNGRYAFGWTSKNRVEGEVQQGEEFAEIGSEEAREFVRKSLENGHLYGFDSEH